MEADNPLSALQYVLTLIRNGDASLTPEVLTFLSETVYKATEEYVQIIDELERVKELAGKCREASAAPVDIANVLETIGTENIQVESLVIHEERE